MCEVAVIVIFTDAGQLADLMKRVLVGYVCDALTNGELVEFVLPGDFFFAAHGFSQTGSLSHFVKFIIPTHLSPSSFPCTAKRFLGDQ